MQQPTTPPDDRIPLRYRVLLWCYPRSLRRTFGRDLWQFVARQRMEHCYRERRGGGLRFWTDVVFDAVLTGLRMRWRALFDRRTSQQGLRFKSAWRIDVHGVIQDIRVSVRSLLRAPTYTVVSVLTLAATTLGHASRGRRTATIGSARTAPNTKTSGAPAPSNPTGWREVSYRPPESRRPSRRSVAHRRTRKWKVTAPTAP